MEQEPTGGIATEERTPENTTTAETTTPPMAGTQADGHGTDTPPTETPE